MEYIDLNNRLYKIFCFEYKKERKRSNSFWNDFIDSKNLGIAHSHSYKKEFTNTEVYKKINVYRITDKKKWLFNKLKYAL